MMVEKDSAPLKLSINFWPWYPVKTILSNTELALKYYPYDTVYLCDEYQYTDPFTALAAIAIELQTSVGTYVTFPSRNPLYSAQKFASISELLPEGREFVAGYASGGAVQRQVMLNHPGPIAETAEATRLLCRLLAGEVVALSEFPRLGKRFGFNLEGKAKLYFPPKRNVPVCVGAGGPRIGEVAGRDADGVILGLLHPVSCLSAMRTGLFQEYVQLVDKARENSPNPDRDYRRIYGIKVSVSNDRTAAREFAKKNMGYALATFMPHYPREFERLGISEAEVEDSGLREAYEQALGVEEAAKRVTDELLDKSTFIAAGTPDEVRDVCVEVATFLKSAGFNDVVFAGSLGPDLPEALQILGEEIAPAIEEAFS